MKKVDVLNIKKFRDDDGNEDFYASTLSGHLENHHKDIQLPHKHDFYLAMLFTKGNGIHEIDFTSYPVRPGALFFLNPGQTHHWELSEDTDGYIFFHTREFYEVHYTDSRLSHYPFFGNTSAMPHLALTGNESKQMEQLFRDICEEQIGDRPFKTECITSQITLLYIEAARLYPSSPDNNTATAIYYHTFRKFQELVDINFANEKSPSAYAGMLSITPKHLNRITTAVARKTASDMILDRIVLEAKRQLVLQHSGFAAVAEMLGYDDYAYFSRIFRKRTGETPSGFLARYKR